jgi:hypothetical protein
MDENEMEKEAATGHRRDWRTYVLIAVSCVAILAVAAGIALAVTGAGRDDGCAPAAAGNAAVGARNGAGTGQGYCGMRGQGPNGTCDGECDSSGTGACNYENCPAAGQSAPGAGQGIGPGQGDCCTGR